MTSSGKEETVVMIWWDKEWWKDDLTSRDHKVSFRHAKLEVLAAHPKENGPSDCGMEIRAQSPEKPMSWVQGEGASS